MIDPLNSLAFSIYENKAVYCVLLGSGVSRAAEIPTGWEITLDLVRRVAALEGVTDEPDWAAWFRRAHQSEPGYSDLLDQLAATPDERRAILHSYIEPTPEELEAGKKVPTKAHRAIARLVQAGYVRVILTTNFDRLMESALRDLGIEPTVIASEDALKGAVPFIHSRCYVVKMHGDYLDTRILNTEVELSKYTKAMNTLLDRIIDEHGLIVSGWSGDWDPALRAAITRAPTRRYPMYWAARGEPSKIAADLIGQRVGRVVRIDGADAFFEGLERLVSSQAEIKRQNPQSVELMVASAKRYLAKPEFRIQLGDLIGKETRKLERTLKGPDFALSGAFSNELIVQRIARLESATEALARIMGILGRWGTGSELRMVVDLLMQFGVRDSVGGLVILIHLRTYPAVLLLYAYGLGLLAARRYADLFKLFSATLVTDRDTASTVVGHLFLNAWAGGANDAWKILPGFERRKTALSDHLHELFQGWTGDYLFSPDGFTTFFEEFELLGSLAYISLGTSKEDLQGVASRQTDRFIWCPIGRVSWDGQTRRRLIERWQLDEAAEELTQAGFARRDKDYLKLAIDSLSHFAARLEW
ncbi:MULTISPECIES: SIR2 family protein [unclassified Bradyrhizobium]|uniref:SIR2 family protein n=1 Tax=unclassified Bradyrhizobium TaxID=2631580 RepID=UPI001FFA8D74|nr:MULTISPECIES: SIR2 family protein [unclassified Bradyrhizobium]MCK1615005.1 SIR2 family protein [Bradyrhizobium sp. 163]MCK1761721.1 SIR2 family protein [Bradyrhizobium sp. 136]